MSRASILAFLVLAGCPPFSTVEPYYSGKGGPNVTAISPPSEVGNVGGGTATIVGSGFGEDPAQVMVQFGSTNAEILSVADGAITVVVPQGTMSAGPVTVTVATPKGYQRVEDGYTYDVGSTYVNQRAYVQVNNFANAGAAAYFGSTGTNGAAEAFGFGTGRYHTPASGFWGVVDYGAQEWKVEQPAMSKFAFGVDDLREEIGPLRLVNPTFEEESFAYCVDFSRDTPRTTVADDGVCDAETYTYDAAVMDFCTYNDSVGVPTYSYEADWPITKDFFSVRGASSEIRVEAPEIGIPGTLVTLPEPAVFTADLGFADPETWSSSTFTDCAEGSNSFVFRWTPSDVTYAPVDTTCVEGAGAAACAPGTIRAVQTYVQITFEVVPYGWFGINSPVKRAIITVPDDFNGTREGSVVEVPKEIIRQLPTVAAPPGGMSISSLNPEIAYGYMFVSALRVTDYAIYSPEKFDGSGKDGGLGGDLVFSYVTGDVGIFPWTNPEDSCL